MKILFVSAILPYPPYSGGQVRIYNLLKHVGKLHDITLLSFIRKPEETEFIKNLDFVRTLTVMRGSRLQPRYLAKFMTGSSLLLASYENAEMRDRIAEELTSNRYDLVHIEPFYVSPSLPRIDIPLVVAEHNAEYQVYKRYMQNAGFPLKQVLKIETERIRRAEAATLGMATRIIAVSESDRKTIQGMAPGKSVAVIPNGVDTQYYAYGKIKRTAAPVFLFTGDFKWLPNRDMLMRLLTEIWPAIRSRIGTANLRIIGRSFPGKMRRFIGSGVTLSENVPDMRSEYSQASVLLAPVSIGGGSKYKILEAMATGVPVLTTPEGLSGLDAVGGKHAIIAHGGEEFAEKANEILKNPEKSGKITQAARSLIEEKYSWENISHDLLNVWESVRKGVS